MATDFVPPDFHAPPFDAAEGFHLEPLGPEHNDRDYEAWMSSVEHIHATPGFPWGDWPAAMSLEENLKDLEMHARHFEERRGFTYSILDGDDVIGCLYIYPSSEPGVDADVRSWVTATRSDMDAQVWRQISAWLEQAWPFTSLDYAARS